MNNSVQKKVKNNHDDGSILAIIVDVFCHFGFFTKSVEKL